MNKLLHASALALSLIATAASAQAVRTEKNMSLELANQIAAATVASCTAAGYNVTATVVDRAGTRARPATRRQRRPAHRGRRARQGLHLGVRQEQHQRHAGKRAEEPRRGRRWSTSPAS